VGGINFIFKKERKKKNRPYIYLTEAHAFEDRCSEAAV
jgi:hypothetical protein